MKVLAATAVAAAAGAVLLTVWGNAEIAKCDRHYDECFTSGMFQILGAIALVAVSAAAVLGITGWALWRALQRNLRGSQ